MISKLLISLAIVLAGVVGLYYRSKLIAGMESGLVKLPFMSGKYGKYVRYAIEYGLLGAGLLLVAGGIYSLVQYAKTGSAPGIYESLDDIKEDVEYTADVFGNEIAKVEGQIFGKGDYAAKKAAALVAVDAAVITSGVATASHAAGGAAPHTVAAKGPGALPVRSATVSHLVHPMGVHVGVSASAIDHFIDQRSRPLISLGGECSGPLKKGGNCEGLSRHFRDGKEINACDKLMVRAPQNIPPFERQAVTFAY